MVFSSSSLFVLYSRHRCEHITHRSTPLEWLVVESSSDFILYFGIDDTIWHPSVLPYVTAAWVRSRALFLVYVACRRLNNGKCLACDAFGLRHLHNVSTCHQETKVQNTRDICHVPTRATCGVDHMFQLRWNVRKSPRYCIRDGSKYTTWHLSRITAAFSSAYRATWSTIQNVPAVDIMLTRNAAGQFDEPCCKRTRDWPTWLISWTSLSVIKPTWCWQYIGTVSHANVTGITNDQRTSTA